MELFSVFITLAFLIVLYYFVARRLNVVDKPNNRSSHTVPTVRGGGIVFLIALMIFWVVYDFSYTYFIIGTFLIAALSFLDDIITLSPRLRLPVQCIAIALLLYQIGFSSFPMWTYLPLLVAGVGILNMFNFMDGVNGITGIYSLVLLSSFYYLNLHFSIVTNEFIIYLMLSIVVFGFFNFRKKAIMFAGDVGAITIGMALFFLWIKIFIATYSTLPILLFIVYGADSLMTILYRAYKKEKIWEAHRSHIYQRLVDVFKFSHLKVSMIYGFVQAVISTVAIYSIINVDSSLHWIITLFFIILLVIVYITIFSKSLKK